MAPASLPKMGQDAARMLRLVMISVFLIYDEDAWEVPDELNQQLPELKFPSTQIEEMLEGLWT